MTNLTIKAGPGARRWIEDNGLYPDHVRVIPGAAGGPKWIVLAGLDRFLFGEWLPGVDHPVDLIGTSIGAWRFAMAAQKDPAMAIDRFHDVYFTEWDVRRPTPGDISVFFAETLDGLLGESGEDEILDNDTFRLHTIVTRARGLNGSDHRALLVPGLAAAGSANLVNRRLLSLFFERVLFHHAASTSFRGLPHFRQESVPLSRANLRGALLATGSIPFVMAGIFQIGGIAPGCYRDGGIIDYHLDLPWPKDEGIVLYPHYTDRIVPGWFDKRLPWRGPDPANSDRTLLIAPSPEFLASLPHGKIPDRRDFARFAGRDHARLRYWEEVFARGRDLADEFAELLASGELAARIEPL